MTTKQNTLTPGPSPGGRGGSRNGALTPGPSPRRRRGSRDKPSLPIPSLLQIVVECGSEREQQDLFERLRKEGYPCRVLTL